MSLIEWAAVLVIVGVALVVWQLGRISTRLHQMVMTLQSIDAEVFRLAQEQNPNYGVCSDCGHRAIVRHVIPKDSTRDAVEPALFYCMACWWMSDSVMLGDKDKHYKDRLSELDRRAMSVGPNGG